jgi:acyl-CoA thioester hydrolase
MADAALMDSHRYRVRVFYEDTDAGGIVYHANYLRFAERARTEMLRAGGIDHTSLQDEEAVAFTVRHCTVDFRRPAGLDDLLEVRTRFAEPKGARLEGEQTIHKVESGSDQATDEALVEIVLTLALIDRQGRPTRFPPRLRHALTGTSVTPR